MNKITIGSILILSILVILGLYLSDENDNFGLVDGSEDKKIEAPLANSNGSVPSGVSIINGEQVIPLGGLPDADLLAKNKKSVVFKSIQSNKELKKVKKELISLFKLPIGKIKYKINLIKMKQDQIKEWKYSDGQALNKLEVIKPEYAITMAIVLKKSIGKVIEEDSSSFKLELSDLYVIQTFSESKDFNILLTQNRLNSKEINLKRLKEVYSNETEKAYFDDGRIEGIPSSAPSIIPEGLDNEN